MSDDKENDEDWVMPAQSFGSAYHDDSPDEYEPEAKKPKKKTKESNNGKTKIKHTRKSNSKEQVPKISPKAVSKRTSKTEKEKTEEKIQLTASYEQSFAILAAMGMDSLKEQLVMDSQEIVKDFELSNNSLKDKEEIYADVDVEVDIDKLSDTLGLPAPATLLNADVEATNKLFPQMKNIAALSKTNAHAKVSKKSSSDTRDPTAPSSTNTDVEIANKLSDSRKLTSPLTTNADGEVLETMESSASTRNSAVEVSNNSSDDKNLIGHSTTCANAWEPKLISLMHEVSELKETVSNFQGLLSRALALLEKSTQCRSCVKENYKILKAGSSEMNISGVESTQNSSPKVQVKSSASKTQESHSASSTQRVVIGVCNENVQNQDVNVLDDNKESKNESLPPKLPALSLKEKDDSAADFPLGVFIQKDNLESIKEGKTPGLYINRLVEVVFDRLVFFQI